MSKKSVLFSVSLLVLFIAFYQLFNDTPAGDAEPIGLSAPTGLRWDWAGIVFVSFFGLFYWRLKRVEKHNLAGITLLAEGRYLEALEAFQKAPRHVATIHNAGVAQLGLWRVAEAEASFARILAKPAFVVRSLRVHAAPFRALALALLGRRSEAASQLAECDTLQVGATWNAILARAVLAARAGDWTEARELLARPNLNEPGGRCRGLAEALKLWAAEQLSGPGHSGNLDRVALFGESGPEVFQEIWPEFHRFLERHQPLEP